MKVQQRSTRLQWNSTGHPLDLHQKFVEIIWIALITFENNAWISSFQSILKQIVVSNFKWYLHTLMYMHIKWVIQRQANCASQTIQVIDENNNEKEVESKDEAGDVALVD